MFSRPSREGHRGLHHRPLRLTPPPRDSTSPPPASRLRPRADHPPVIMQHWTSAPGPPGAVRPRPPLGDHAVGPLRRRPPRPRLPPRRTADGCGSAVARPRAARRHRARTPATGRAPARWSRPRSPSRTARRLPAVTRSRACWSAVRCASSPSNSSARSSARQPMSSRATKSAVAVEDLDLRLRAREAGVDAAQAACGSPAATRRADRPVPPARGPARRRGSRRIGRGPPRPPRDSSPAARRATSRAASASGRAQQPSQVGRGPRRGRDGDTAERRRRRPSERTGAAERVRASASADAPAGPITSIGGLVRWAPMASASTPHIQAAVRPQTTVPPGTTFATARARRSSVSGTASSTKTPRSRRRSRRPARSARTSRGRARRERGPVPVKGSGPKRRAVRRWQRHRRRAAVGVLAGGRCPQPAPGEVGLPKLHDHRRGGGAADLRGRSRSPKLHDHRGGGVVAAAGSGEEGSGSGEEEVERRRRRGRRPGRPSGW